MVFVNTARSQEIDLLVESGDPAPGLSGVTFSNVYQPSINANGEIAFFAKLAGSGVTNSNDGSLWYGSPSNLKLIAREGMTAPSTETGTVFQTYYGTAGGQPLLRAPSITTAGRVAFKAQLTGPAVSADNNDAIYVYDPVSDGLELLIRNGNPATGTTAGVVFDELSKWVYSNGGLVVSVSLTGAGVTVADNSGIWAGSLSSNITKLLRSGDMAPGYSDGTIQDFDVTNLSINPSGDTAFVAGVSRPLPNSSPSVLYAGSPVNIRKVIATGELSPVDGYNFSGFSQSANATARSIGASGHVSFYSNLLCDSGSTCTPSSRKGIFIETTAGIEVVALSDEAIDLSGVEWSSMWAYPVGGDGTIAVWGKITGGSVTLANDLVIYAGTPGSMQLLAREGDPAPGTNNGTFSDLDRPLVDSSGRVSFTGRLDSGERGVWWGTPGSVALVALGGEAYADAGNRCDKRTLNTGVSGPNSFENSAPYGSGNADGIPSAASDNGQIAFRSNANGPTGWNNGIYLSDSPVSSPKPQIIWLDFGTPVPALFESQKDWILTILNGKEITRWTKRVEIGQTAAATVKQPDQEAVADEVCNILANQQLDIPVVLSKPADLSYTVRVYFGGTISNFYSIFGVAYDVSPTGNTGEVDRFNIKKDGAVTLLNVDMSFDANGDPLPNWATSAAEIVVHEFGHAVGLRHVNGTLSGGNEIMDYFVPSPNPVFTDVPVNVIEPPNTDGIVCNVDHNPLYHMQRYGLQQSPTSIPGLWDIQSYRRQHLRLLSLEITQSPKASVFRQLFLAGMADAWVTTAIENANECANIASPNFTSDKKIILKHIDNFGPQNLMAAQTSVSYGGKISIEASSDNTNEIDIFLGTGDASNPQWGVDVSASGPISGKIFLVDRTTLTVSEIGSFGAEISLHEVVSGGDTTDSDGDGLSDEFETELGTDPLVADTDGDGLTDYEEVAFDGNGLVYEIGIDPDPTNPDSDSDGLSDGLEVSNGADPLDPTSYPTLADSDLAPLGSPDGIINAGDLLIAVRISLGMLTPGTLELAHGDMNADGVINLSDVIVITNNVLN